MSVGFWMGEVEDGGGMDIDAGTADCGMILDGRVPGDGAPEGGSSFARFMAGCWEEGGDMAIGVEGFVSGMVGSSVGEGRI